MCRPVYRKIQSLKGPSTCAGGLTRFGGTGTGLERGWWAFLNFALARAPRNSSPGFLEEFYKGETVPGSF
ncbi:MAG: hypothetical protein B6240_08330 [Desulfobacteraceae bacterium 4572_87]|nr:MAG: hypothetical protein B6240_08330 [Desulfobacteraceae bacterium 4572_87]